MNIVLNDRRLKCQAKAQVQNQIQRLQRIELDKVTCVFAIIDDNSLRKRKPKATFFGFGRLHDEFQKFMSGPERSEKKSRMRAEAVTPATPGKLPAYPGAAKGLADSQRALLEKMKVSPKESGGIIV